MEMVDEYVMREVGDWDDEFVARARFKAFSGQRSDWEPHFYFWRDLIFKVASHLGIFIIQPSQVRSSWFVRGGLTPLCIDHVLIEMHKRGDLFRIEDLVDPTTIPRIPQLLQTFSRLIPVFRSLPPDQILQKPLILKTLMEERAAQVIRHLSQNHWTPYCVITIENFQSICNGSVEASAILTYLSGIGKARLLSTHIDYIKGVKISLAPVVVPIVSELDSNVLHLSWTAENLQRQLDVIDQCWQRSRKGAIAFKQSGNKQAAVRCVRQLKSTSISRDKCNSLLNNVEEVLGVISNVESTKQVSEAIRIGARAIKEIGISVEEVQLTLQELDESVAFQKEVEEALESFQLEHPDIEDESVLEELKKLELEMADETPHIQILGTRVNTSAKGERNTRSNESVKNTISEDKLEGAAEKVYSEETVETLSNNLSNIKLEAA
ncbi:hypothetical protein Syun_008229 [Stephania yunnanensis]|uniref:Charged multivesicular body protein 7 n=1 Tax=Stephania yunnanensis TaxID=152371 RepID=A0AAP0PZJ9_9MAGN